jgi:toxin-antitoxin system PIN domain toxin
VILDANVLLYARNSADARHRPARAFLEEVLNGPHRVGLPWQSLTAFLRIATNQRVFAAPLSPAQGADQVSQWLDAPAAWVPVPTGRHADVLLGLVRDLRLSGALLTDAHLAALALEHGTGVWSTDTDFARFPGLRWEDPLRGR